MAFDITQYRPEEHAEWDSFVESSRNGTFLFLRPYMDYHSDRFEDHSLLFRRGGRLLAILPANRRGDEIVSHGGLTYGSLVMATDLRVADTVTLFQEMNEYLRQEGIKRVTYKAIPWVYHRLPAEEDLYAMYHTCHARIIARDFSTCIFLDKNLRWERIRRRGVARAQKAGITVERTNDYGPFWQVLNDNLQTKYGVKPVHTLAEIELLASRFPENIVLYTASHQGQVVAGVVLYVTQQVVHAQYSSATPEGKELGAIDFIYEQIMHHDFAHYPYFDFGRSTDNADGSSLNMPLVFQKEGYGGRGLCYDVYQWETSADLRIY